MLSLTKTLRQSWQRWALRKKQRQGLVRLAVMLATVAGLLGLRQMGALSRLELAALDALFRSRPPEGPDPRILLVAIDEASIQSVQRWPWSDGLFADLIEKIAAGQPAAIGLDKYFDIPTGDGCRSLPDPGCPDRLRLQQVVNRTPNVVAVSFLAIRPQDIPVPFPQDFTHAWDAFSNLPIDGGGVVRRALLAADYGSFALTLANLYLQHRGLPPYTLMGDRLRSGNVVIPRFTPNFGGYHQEDDAGYQTLIGFRGGPGTFRQVAAADVLAGKIAPDTFRDRIVMVGAMAPSVKDNFPTPYETDGQTMYGVEIHANIVSQLVAAAIEERPLLRAWPNFWEGVWLGAWALIGGVTALTTDEVQQKLLGLTLMATLAGGSAVVLFWAGWWVPTLGAILGAVLTHGLVVACELSQEQADRSVLMRLFAQHVSRELAENIWQNRDLFLSEGRIAGREMFVTVLFTDMRNFSTAAEMQQPHETLDWLNTYLGAIAEEVIAQGGMVDKYIGDAVMAVFGVPIPSLTEAEWRRDAVRAVTAAIEMAHKLDRLSREWIAQGLPETVTGIGINSGRAIAGSLGSAERLEYSAIGDAVNVAARLESLNKEVDGGPLHILISEDTYRLLDDRFRVELAGHCRLKGRTAETVVYRVLGYRSAVEPNPHPLGETPSPH